MPHAVFRSATMASVACQTCELEGADFTEANLVRTDFSECRGCGGISFRHAYITDSYFVHSDLDGSIFLRTTIVGSDFSDAEMEGITADKATLTGVRFTRANLNGGSFRGSKARGVDWSSIRNGDKADFRELQTEPLDQQAFSSAEAEYVSNALAVFKAENSTDSPLLRKKNEVDAIITSCRLSDERGWISRYQASTSDKELESYFVDLACRGQTMACSVAYRALGSPRDGVDENSALARKLEEARDRGGQCVGVVQFAMSTALCAGESSIILWKQIQRIGKGSALRVDQH
jgi:hypothetical protein